MTQVTTGSDFARNAAAFQQGRGAPRAGTASAAAAGSSDTLSSARAARVAIDGKLFSLGGRPWYLRGLTYGPFPPRSDGEHLPEPGRLAADFARVAALGANALRVYYPPARDVLDVALAHGLRLLVDVPWEKHRAFFEDHAAHRGAREMVARVARDLGDHPAVLGVSVGNEIPHDVARFYGARRVGRFVDELLDVARQAAGGGCLVTYTNYPSTEFLAPTRLDFHCVNLYLEDPAAFGGYLERLQHLAGNLPLVLGEFGTDAFRHGPDGQADAVAGQVAAVFRKGLAGGFVFSYTDEWFAGGHAVEGWAFGVTDRARREKPAAAAVRRAWAAEPVSLGAADGPPPPRVSVVVCTYNGSRTLAGCLQALSRLDYPDYEVVVVDDGSTDATPDVAARFPFARYQRQVNLGLSAARNAGLAAATGRVVAYTDDDCEPDPRWLRYLVAAMEDQGVEAIGGPNVPPAGDGWVAHCVAASPGGPAHVMLDDRLAEHVPGCNMAFDREALQAIGGFDAQFRVAGDDVDVCWRLLDAGRRIGFAPGALVWHHRRTSVGAYLRQQRGYGRAEAMLQFKHPDRFNRLGASRWRGVIYGDGAAGLPVVAPAVYHGRFGTGPFQIIYRRNHYSRWALVTLLEWHGLAASIAVSSALAYPPAIVLAAVLWLLTLAGAARAAATAHLPPGMPLAARPLLFVLHLAQPVVRGWHRYQRRLTMRRVPEPAAVPESVTTLTWKRVAPGVDDVYWASDAGRGREHLLDALERRSRADGWRGDFHAEWHAHDVELWPDPWHNVRIVTLTEELGGARRFTRARAAWSLSLPARTAVLAFAFLAGVAWAQWHPAAAAAASLPLVAVLVATLLSLRWCRRAALRLLQASGESAGLVPVPHVSST